MKSRNLNDILRTRISNKALEKAGVQKKVFAAQEQFLILVSKVIEDLFTPKDFNEVLKQIKSNQNFSTKYKGRLSCSSSSSQNNSINVAGRRYNIPAGISWNKLAEKYDGIKVLCYYYIDGLTVPAGDLADQFHACVKDIEKAQDVVSELKRSLKTVLNSVKTTKQLIAVWPEVVELLPPEEAPKQLPAIRTESLNKAIGLPS